MTSNPISSRIHGPILLVSAVFLVVVMPWLNSCGLIADFTLNLWGKYLCYGIMAVAIDLLWGFTGLLCLGQALFFSLGGYMMGMHLMLMIGKLGQYKSDLPDFMVFLGHTTLPGFWQAFHSFPFALAMVFLVPGLLALVFGYLAFRSRIKGVYFSILTQALTYGAALLFFRNDLLMGGNNGFTDFRTLLGSDLRIASTQRILYICIAVSRGGRRLQMADKIPVWPDPACHPRFGEPRAVLRLRHRQLQTLHLRHQRHDRRNSRRSLCPAGRHHQP